MRGKIFIVSLMALGAIGYIAAPFYTAWSIRDAAKTGKPEVLARSVYWPTVKTTLKASLRQIAVPANSVSPAAMENSGFFSRLWLRVKKNVSHGVVDRLVEKYANPTGFAQVFNYGRVYRTQIRGMKDPEESLPLLQKIKAVWARVKRAEFISMTRFEIDMIDKFEPGRMYSGVLELKNLKWMLMEVHVLQATAQQLASVRDF